MITQDFRIKVQQAILEHRNNFPSFSDAKFAKMINLNAAIYSRLKNGETEKLAGDSWWIEQGRKLSVSIYEKNWNIVRTSVYEEVEQTINFCKNFQKATIFIDICGIGKTCCTKHVIRTMQNAFYVDCSQAPTKSLFIRHLAQILGVDNTGRLSDVKENVKYYINMMDSPFIALDDAGYLDPKVFVEIIELWNATEGRCGWMIIGDDSLQALIEKGLKSKKVGFKALFSRFSDEFIHCVPVLKQEKTNFLKQLIGDVAHGNMQDKTNINKVINLCIGKEKTLRHLETLIQLDKKL
jgi:hypothetical protein